MSTTSILPSSVLAVQSPEIATYIDQLEQDIHVLSWKDSYGCMTFQGFNRRIRSIDTADYTVIFGDIDHMHALNSALGYAEVDRRIRTAVERIHTRSSDRLITTCCAEGDEVAWIVPTDDASGLTERIITAFQSVGLSITVGSAHVATSVQMALTAASDAVQHAKAQRPFWRRWRVFGRWNITTNIPL